MFLEGSDPDLNPVLRHSKSVFGIFTVQFSRFLAEIDDFEHFSWAPVQDFSKNAWFLERCLSVFAIFACFSGFDHVLEHCLWCFGISVIIF